MRTKHFVLSVLCLLIAGCAGPTVNSEHDPEALANFGRYQTYAWQQNPSGTDARLNPAVGPLVVAAADEALAAKGYRLAATGQPDFFVVWRATIETRQSVSEIDIGPRTGAPGGRLSGGAAVRQTVPLTREFNEGTLILDIVDGPTGRQVWRGWAQGEIQKAVDPGERETRIRTAVRKILDEFPPKR